MNFTEIFKLRNLSLLFFTQLDYFLKEENKILILQGKNDVFLSSHLKIIKQNIKKLLRSVEEKNSIQFKQNFHIHYILVKDYHSYWKMAYSNRVKKYYRLVRSIRRTDLNMFFKDGILKELHFLALKNNLHKLPIKERLKVKKYFNRK